MQLDAVLRSLQLHCKDLELAKITVLYRATEGVHSGQYRHLVDNYPDVSFYRQNHFKIDVVHIINQHHYSRIIKFLTHLISVFDELLAAAVFFVPRKIRSKLSTSIFRFFRTLLGDVPANLMVMFLVDDNIFVKDFYLAEITSQLLNLPDSIGFSLRLGLNTHYCYTLDSRQRLKEYSRVKNIFLRFDWTKSEYDFGYPLEISSSIYRLRDLLPFLASLYFRNPNELEGQLASYTHFLKDQPYLLSYIQSVTFCNPINIVQTVSNNRASDELCYTIDMLAEEFDKGNRVDIMEYAGFIPDACHQEVELKFVNIKAADS